MQRRCHRSSCSLKHFRWLWGGALPDSRSDGRAGNQTLQKRFSFLVRCSAPPPCREAMIGPSVDASRASWNAGRVNIWSPPGELCSGQGVGVPSRRDTPVTFRFAGMRTCSFQKTPGFVSGVMHRAIVGVEVLALLRGVFVPVCC